MHARSLYTSIVIVVLILTVPYAGAQTVEKGKSGFTQFNEKVTLEVYAGYLTGQSREFVYNPYSGNKMSELIWKIDGVWVLGGTLSVHPTDWLTLRLSGWVPLSDSGTMDDYDWKYVGRDWSDWSHHGDTRLESAYMFDTGLAARFASFGKNQVFDSARLEFLAGYRQLYLSWTAYGGSYIYSDSGAYRGDIGGFPKGQPGISYEQWMKAPYLGLGAA